MSVRKSSLSLIQAVLCSAKRTFARSGSKSSGSSLFQRNQGSSSFALSAEDFKASLAELKALLDQLRACDVGLEGSKALLPKSSPSSSASSSSSSLGSTHDACSAAPVTYIKIHEDQDVSIGIFVVKAGSQIPLHNHPKMHGMLKVLYGTVDVSIYSKVKPGNHSHLDIPQVLVDKTHLIDQGFVFPTHKTLLKSVTDQHEALVLSPEENNYHEIRTVGDEPAAFFDILAPPYHTDADFVHDEEEVRECHFFCEIGLMSKPGSSNNNIHSEQQAENHKSQHGQCVWLRRIKSPEDYFCDTEAYCGPSLNLEN